MMLADIWWMVYLRADSRFFLHDVNVKKKVLECNVNCYEIVRNRGCTQGNTVAVYLMNL